MEEIFKPYTKISVDGGLSFYQMDAVLMAIGWVRANGKRSDASVNSSDGGDFTATAYPHTSGLISWSLNDANVCIARGLADPKEQMEW